MFLFGLLVTGHPVAQVFVQVGDQSSTTLLLEIGFGICSVKPVGCNSISSSFPLNDKIETHNSKLNSFVAPPWLAALLISRWFFLSIRLDFVLGDAGFLFFGAFVCSLQSFLCSRPMIAVRSSKSRGKESTDSSSQSNSLQLNSEIVGTSQVDCDLGNQRKKKMKKEKGYFLEESPTIPNKNPKLLFNKIYGCNAFDTCS